MLDLEYQVIKKTQIPAQRAPHNDRYGQWLAMMRMVAMLEPDEAVEVPLRSDMIVRNVLGSFHTAARKVGLRVSTMTSMEAIYIVRTARTNPREALLHRVVCQACADEFKTSRAWQKYCGRAECRKARHQAAVSKYQKRIAAEKAAAEGEGR
jgi:hypothetical protein